MKENNNWASEKMTRASKTEDLLAPEGQAKMSLFLVLVLKKRRGVKKVGNCTGNEILRFLFFELCFIHLAA